MTTTERSLGNRFDAGEWVLTQAYIALPCDHCGALIPGQSGFESKLPPIMRATGEYSPERRCADCMAKEGAGTDEER